MPMTPPERQQVLDAVEQLLVDEVYGQFADLYSAAVSSTEAHPEQVNNEIRNTLTHIARAVAADSAADALGEIAAATRHVERAKRDAVKIAVIILRDRIDEACFHIRLYTGTVDPAFLVRRDDIRKRRKAILAAETQGKLVLNDFVQLYLDADQLNDDLQVILGQAGKRLNRKGYWLHSAKRSAGSIALGIAIGVFGTAVAAVFIPDAARFGNDARRLLHLPTVTAASPTTGAPVSKK